MNISLESNEGRELLVSSGGLGNFIKLARYYQGQEELTYCGLATVAMILNFKKVKLDNKKPSITQSNILKHPKFDSVMPLEILRTQGMAVHRIKNILSLFDINSQCKLASDSSLNDFRKTLVETINVKKSIFVVGYDRRILDQEGKGHISPIVAYDTQFDKTLIMDVTNYKFPSVWVDLSKLWEAVNSLTSKKITRSYLWL